MVEPRQSRAKRLAKKLAQRFVSDNPSTTLINLMASTYLKYDTAIVPNANCVMMTMTGLE